MLKWPDRKIVHKAFVDWLAAQQPIEGLLKAGYFGSYAREDWSVGSDLDILLIVKEDERPFSYRSVRWDFSSFPVPVDVLVYTEEEWLTLAQQRGRFYQIIEQEAIWVYDRLS